MTRLLRSKFYRLIRSSLWLVAIFVILVADIFLSTRCEVTGANMYQLPELCTMSQFTKYADNAKMDVRSAVKFFVQKGKLEDSQAEDIIGVFQDTHPWQFRWVLASQKNVLVFPLIFAMAFLAMDLERRSLNNLFYGGHSRKSIYFSGVIFLFIVGFLVSLAGICAITGIYAGTVYSRLPKAYVWSRLVIHALMDAAMMAPPLLLVLLVRKTVVSGAVILVYDLVLRFTGLLRVDMSRWAQGESLLLPAVLSAACILCCAAVGWFAFRRTRLP